ncbi:hypothetical protein UlMin_034534 [Ulmus minor]
MSGGRCHRRKKMMGRGADGGCGTEERPCPVPRVPAKISATQPDISEKSASAEIDFYTQARKALCQRSPFDVTEEASASSVPTLPRALANFLSRQSDTRRRHKKSHPGAQKKSSRRSERAPVSNIWVETEEYFRDLKIADIDTLSEVSNFDPSTARKYFLIPALRSVPRAHADGCGENLNGGNVTEHVAGGENGNGGLVNEVGTENQNAFCEKGNGVVEEEVKKEEGEQPLEDGDLIQTEKGSGMDLSSGLEWLLGSKNKICLTTERPSKKRKLLGADAGLEKVLIASSCDGNSSLCHFCSTGDTGNELNRLICCSSCNVTVHQKCYGVTEDVGSSWLCSWCKQKTDISDSAKPCVLCPKQGGALKPVHPSVEKEGPGEYAHLFCSQWIPEVYIEDLPNMEPIMNVEAIKETRRKLVCNICKVKWGACVRCSNGACRTSFHPLCAREARQRMEVWGKYGCDQVELRAFCSKHSEVQNINTTSQSVGPPVAVGSNSNATNHHSESLLMNKVQNFEVGCRNGDNAGVQIEAHDTNSDRSCETESQDMDFLSSKLHARLKSECNDSESINDAVASERFSEDVNACGSIDFALILKKLVDHGSVNMEDVASEIGISPDSLSASLADDAVVPDLLCKIVQWLKNNVYLNTVQKNMKVKPKVSSKPDLEAIDNTDAALVTGSDTADSVAVKSVPPRRRTTNNIRVFNDTNVLCSSEEIFCDKERVKDDVKVDQPIAKESENKSDVSNADAVKNMTEAEGFQNSRPVLSVECQASPAEPINCTLQQCGEVGEITSPLQDTLVNADGNPSSSVVNPVVPSLQKAEEAVSCFHVHPDTHKLLQMQDGLKDGELSCFDASANASVCCNHLNKHPRCNEQICQSDVLNLEQLIKARKMGILGLSPEDEVEGEIFYFQHRLLSNAVVTKLSTDKLIYNVSKKLPEEIEVARTNRWDAVLVNQYLYELREAKKQGRKERRHKEAQAVLAAATAAAAASSRISSLRKDAFDETAHQENMVKLNTGSCSQLIPRAKESLQRVAVPRISSEKSSDFTQSVADFSKEHPRSCDICRRSETILNPILVCCGCKVAVHLDCYRSVKESTGPWYCELCEELSLSRSSGAPAVNFWEKPYFVAECGLCGGTTGAFRKSSDGQWVHAFCAEWVFETTFRRGQVNFVQGMEAVPKGVDSCHICHRKYGVCIKCNYGNCQATFHPSCCRSAGLYMNIKNSGGKLQHKAYCEKHSSEQRAKAETQKHGIEELKSFKQMRVELERLRLLCERIVKREKLKRELVLCSHDILAVKRDHVARSMLVHSPFLHPDVSSESVTTSLKQGAADSYRSCSEAIQRSDDITVDSTISFKRRGKVAGPVNDQRTDDDCTTSETHFTQKPMNRPPFSGKQIPNRPSAVATRNPSDDGGWVSKSKKQETFGKELVMTSDQASVRNMRLPKGYAYVPADCLPNEKQNNQDSFSGEQLEHGG